MTAHKSVIMTAYFKVPTTRTLISPFITIRPNSLYGSYLYTDMPGYDRCKNDRDVIILLKCRFVQNDAHARGRKSLLNRSYRYTK